MKKIIHGKYDFVFFFCRRHAATFSVVAMNKKRLTAECPYWRDRRHGGFLVICPLGESCEFFHPEVLELAMPPDMPILEFIEYAKPQLNAVKFYLFLNASQTTNQTPNQTPNQTHDKSQITANDNNKENTMPPVCLFREWGESVKRVKLAGTCPYWRDKHVAAFNLTVTCPIGESCEFFHPTPQMLGDHKAPHTYDPLKKVF